MPNKSKIPAIVYPSNTASGFGIIRSLANHGIPIIGLDCGRNFVSLSRKFKSNVCPDPTENQGNFLQFLIGEGKKVGPSVFFTSSDLVVFIMSKNKSILSKYYLFPYLDSPSVEGSIDKWTMHQIAEKIGIPVPKTFSPKSTDEVKNAHFTFPVIIKPITSQFIAAGNCAIRINKYLKQYHFQKALKFIDHDRLLDVSTNLFKSGIQFVIQEEIPGSAETLYSTHCYIDKNQVIEIYADRKIRQIPADFGIGTLSENVDCEPIKKYTQLYLKAIHFHGIASIEFKYDDRDRKYKFIEINPRADHRISLSTYCGLNIPLLQYCDLVDKEKYVIKRVYKAARWIWLEGDLAFFAKYALNKSSEYYTSPRKWLDSIFRKPLTEAYMAWDDPVLSLVYIFRCLGLFAIKLVKNLVLVLTGININKR